jgi:N-acetylglucosaminyldiphosphoundecaprenol N-acetyl-beta-D-mannosaminyltransferase
LASLQVKRRTRRLQKGAPVVEVRQWLRHQAGAHGARTAGNALPTDDLARDVYCVLGMPIDMIDMATALARIEAAADAAGPFLVSTCNLNFLAQSLSDPAFRESLYMSDLATADGTPVLWLARLMGLPLKARIAGSDMFEALASRKSWRRQLKVFLFGAPAGVAEAAASRLNAQLRGVVCVGALYPGHGSLADLNRGDFIASINASGADFLAVALGAAKGQAWLRHNHQRLTVPVRAHLGAVIGFQAGTVRRAPRALQKLGLEWVWRIKEEPHLWRRYWRDGCVLLRVLLTRVLPLAVLARFNRWNARHVRPDLEVSARQGVDSVTLHLTGTATAQHLTGVIAHGRAALAADKPRLIVDLSKVDAVDARFLGLLLMLKKCVGQRQGGRLEIAGASAAIRRMFRLNEVAFLLTTSEGGALPISSAENVGAN